MLPDWMLKSKCATQRMDPRLFDYDPANPNDGIPAQILCAGCPVMKECQQWHEQPIPINNYIERFSGAGEVDAYSVPVSGVKAAGKNW